MSQDRRPPNTTPDGAYRQDSEGDWFNDRNVAGPGESRRVQPDPRSARQRQNDERLERLYGPAIELPPAGSRQEAPRPARDTVTRSVEHERGDRENPGSWARTTTYSSASGATLTEFASGPFMQDATTYSITLRDSHGHVLSDEVARNVMRDLERGWPVIRAPWSPDRRDYSEGSPLSRAHDERSHRPGRSLDRGH